MTCSKEGWAPWALMGGGAIPHRTVNKHRPEKAGVASPLPVCLERGKLVTVAVAPRRTLNKNKACGARWMLGSLLRSAINKASSNSWLTVVGRWATASDRHSQSCLQTLFFFLFSFDETTTELQPHAKRLTETVLHLNLGYFVVFYFFVCFVFFPFDEMAELLLRNYLQNWRLGTNSKIIKTDTLLHWNLGIFFLIQSLSV
jgi:hypothetical protein